MPAAALDTHKPFLGFRARLLALALLIAVGTVIAGIAYQYYRAQKGAIEHEVRNQLLSIADLQVAEISERSTQRLDELRLLMADSASTLMMQRTASDSSRPGLAEVRTWLSEICLRLHYAGSTLSDSRGNPIFTVGASFGDGAHIRMVAQEALRADGIVFRDLHTDGPAGAIHMGFNLALRTSPGTPPFGALLLSIDPADRLYPKLKLWPVASQSGETLLVRREGDEIVFLNDLRFRRNAALRLRLPISRRDVPSVQAAMGAHGILEGMDYRGVPVVAAVRAVPDLPWFLVAKMDVEEVEAPIRRRAWLLVLATSSLILATVAAILGLWRRQQLQFYRARYEADLERQALAGHYDYLTRFANDIVLLLDNTGRILEANDRAVTTYGFSREELLRMTLRDLRHSSSMEDYARQWQEVDERGSMVFESVHQTREGHPIPVEISARLIHVGDKQFRQPIIRDISERKLLDEKLRRTLDAHTAVIESSAAAIVTITPDGRVISWNKAAERIFGWTVEEALGNPPLFVPAARRENARLLHQRATQGEVIAGYRGSAQCKDGRVIPVSISAAALHDLEGRPGGVVLNLLDTTEQNLAEESLRRSEELFRATFEQAAVGITYVSLDGRFMQVNPRYCEITGYTREELLGMPIQKLGLAEDAQTTGERAAILLRGAVDSTSYGKRYVRKDGSLVWVQVAVSLLRSASGEPLHFVGVVEDITERINAAEALRRSEERFRTLVESAPEGILVECDRQIRYMNSAAVRLFGAASAAELIGRDILEFTRPEDRVEVVERSAAVTRHIPVPPIERSYLRTDGDFFPVEVSAAPIEFDRQPASLVFLRDIGERKQAETEKRRLEEQLLQVQKMESLGRLAGGVAHDFNNHLTVIDGYCDMLISSLEPGSQREEVEEIRAAGQRAGALTQQLLAFSRKQIVERKPLDLNAVVSESGKMLGRLIGERIQIVTSLDPALGWTIADHAQVIQILMNLVINARDAMPSGGRIVIETANVDLAENARLPSKDAAPGPYVALSVADTGVGMSEETLRHIFEPFFTTKGVGVGTGLGLSTVYGAVRQSGGWLDVESRLGHGSQFRVHLPRTAAPAVTPDRPVAAPKAARGVETVLLAEDQPDVRRLALRILQSNGYRLLEASGGPQALQVSRAHAGPIDLLVTDVIMPEMTGRELATRLRESRPGMKVLYVSGYTADIIGRESVLDPGVHYLPKPFTPAQLSIKVREVLGQSKIAGKILVVDDDDAVRSLIQQTLSDAGYDVQSAGDGREGMRLVAEHPFDLVLTDLIMPDQEGIQTIGDLHRDYPAIRIVAMSGAADSVYLKTAELLGAHVTLHKPIDSQGLLRTIRDLLT